MRGGSRRESGGGGGHRRRDRLGLGRRGWHCRGGGLRRWCVGRRRGNCGCWGKRGGRFRPWGRGGSHNRQGGRRGGRRGSRCRRLSRHAARWGGRSNFNRGRGLRAAGYDAQNEQPGKYHEGKLLHITSIAWVGIRYSIDAVEALRIDRGFVIISRQERRSLGIDSSNRAFASYLRAADWKRERPTQGPSLDPRFRGGDGGRAKNDRRESTNGSYATPSSAFFMRQFQDAIALSLPEFKRLRSGLRKGTPVSPGAF